MATEYKDGSFGETLPFSDAMKTFLEAVESDTAKAFYVGTTKQIEEAKAAADIKRRLSALEDQMAKFAAKQRGIIQIPSHSEIKSLLRFDEL